MTEYLMSQGYSSEEIQTILEEIECHRKDEELLAWVAADPYTFEGEPVDIEVFEDFPF